MMTLIDDIIFSETLLKAAVPVVYSITISNKFQIQLLLMGYVKSCWTMYTLQMQRC